MANHSATGVKDWRTLTIDDAVTRGVRQPAAVQQPQQVVRTPFEARRHLPLHNRGVKPHGQASADVLHPRIELLGQPMEKNPISLGPKLTRLDMFDVFWESIF